MDRWRGFLKLWAQKAIRRVLMPFSSLVAYKSPGKLPRALEPSSQHRRSGHAAYKWAVCLEGPRAWGFELLKRGSEKENLSSASRESLSSHSGTVTCLQPPPIRDRLWATKAPTHEHIFWCMKYGSVIIQTWCCYSRSTGILSGMSQCAP